MPNGAQANENYAWILNYACLFKEAMSFFKKSIRLNPISSSQPYMGLGNCYLSFGRYEEAVLAYKQSIRISPTNNVSHINLASTYMTMGREKEARAEAAEVLRLRPDFSLDQWERTYRSIFKYPSDEYISALRKTGLK